MTGQDLTTTSIISLENFLADNTEFNDFDDIMTFTQETLSEEIDDSILRFIDEPKDATDLLMYFQDKTRNMSGIVETKLEDMIAKFDSETINRLFYKNKVLQFIFDSTYLTDRLNKLVQFTYGEKPEEAMVESLDVFRDIIINFTFSNVIFEDRYKRTMKDMRKSTILADTDSVFINLNNYIQDTTAKLNLDKENKVQQMTVMNVYVDVITQVLKKIFWKLTGNMGLLDEFKPLINMKSEYLYKRIMCTRNKKNYSGIITGELGKLLNHPVLDVKGLAIKKTTVPKRLRVKFTEILTEDILDAEHINIREILGKFDALGLEVERSLKAGELGYSLPKSIEQLDSYKNPSTLEQVRGALVWNALERDNQIMPPEKVNLLKLKTADKNHPALIELSIKYPKKYAVIMKTVFNEGLDKDPEIDISRFGMSVIAVPKGVEQIPEYLRPLIDYRTMVSKNMQNGYIMLESLGIYIEEIDSTQYKSNIIEL